MDWFKWIRALIGHLGWWCVVFNRIHATAFPRSIRKLSEKITLLVVGLPLLWVGTLMLLQGDLRFDTFTAFPVTWLYLYGCVLLGVYFALRWVWRKWSMRLPSMVTQAARETIDLSSQIESDVFQGRFAKTLGLIPFNEAKLLTIERMTFELDVPQALDGLKICQLSDLHFTGQISRDYFESLIDLANDLQPDLFVITGDLVDEAACLDWLDTTLGRLSAPLGTFYVLGNHDKRIRDESSLRSRLHQLGLKPAAGQWHSLDYQGARVQLTGNALPWFPQANQLSPCDEPADLRILLSHSPDQIDWAKRFSFDLMFAGHTHGGQIAFPLIGPVVAPSKYGVLYASGTFMIDSMLMHVSRGISGDEPIRVNSPPEVGLFTIRSKAQANAR